VVRDILLTEAFDQVIADTQDSDLSDPLNIVKIAAVDYVLQNPNITCDAVLKIADGIDTTVDNTRLTEESLKAFELFLSNIELAEDDLSGIMSYGY